jgi:hypothetical protein
MYSYTRFCYYSMAMIRIIVLIGVPLLLVQAQPPIDSSLPSKVSGTQMKDFSKEMGALQTTVNDLTKRLIEREKAESANAISREAAKLELESRTTVATERSFKASLAGVLSSIASLILLGFAARYAKGTLEETRRHANVAEDAFKEQVDQLNAERRPILIPAGSDDAYRVQWTQQDTFYITLKNYGKGIAEAVGHEIQAATVTQLNGNPDNFLRLEPSPNNLKRAVVIPQEECKVEFLARERLNGTGKDTVIPKTSLNVILVNQPAPLKIGFKDLSGSRYELNLLLRFKDGEIRVSVQGQGEVCERQFSD